jgi:hypothetical protein
VAARLEHDPEQGWRAWVAGEPQEWAAAPWDAPMLARIWHYGLMIDQTEHDYLVARYQWAKEHAPDDPMANPTKPVDLKTLPPVF